ncbi:MAG: hypothetical protein ABJF11_13775 [Reichenbachiella sp.]|uniref:DUF350 domain-containing protein n=1 Tax=Reichenbachiella sp. TaxID=2184521 RepID=UPI00326335A9
MNNDIFFLGVIEILSALSMGLVILSTTYKLLKWYGEWKFNIGHNNAAYSIFIASVLFGMGLMVSGTIEPIVSSFRLLANAEDSSSGLILSFLMRGGIYILIAYVAGLLISLMGIMIYSALTPIDEFVEMKNNNIGVAIISGVIIVTLILLTKDGVGLVIESLIPYPELPPR